MQNKSVLVADNQALSRKGILCYLKEFRIFSKIDDVVNKEELTFQLATGNYDLLIIAFDFFDFIDISEMKDIKKIAPATGILVITNNNKPEDILTILNYGIINYILKRCDKSEFTEAIHAALNIRRYYCAEVLDILVEQKAASLQKQDDNSQLTMAEIDIVRFIAQGFTTKEIALKKYLSFHTVNTHRKNIFKKLGINNSSELVMYAIKKGIIITNDFSI